MEINIFLALIAGLGSFFAPCILPIVPAFLAYISGITISDLKKSSGIKTVTIRKTNVILNTIFFVLGFSIVFSAFGIAINSVFSSSTNEVISNFTQFGGIIIMSFGVFMLLSLKIQ